MGPERCANGDCCRFWEGEERNKRIASRKIAEVRRCQSHGWWKRSTMGKQSWLSQCESCRLSAVPIEIAPGSEREERGIKGLHHGRLRKANVASSMDGGRESTVGEQSWLAQQRSYGPNAVPMEIAAASEREERGIRWLIALRKADVASFMAGGGVMWGSNLCCHSTSPVGSVLCQMRLLLVLRGRREE